MLIQIRPMPPDLSLHPSTRFARCAEWTSIQRSRRNRSLKERPITSALKTTRKLSTQLRINSSLPPPSDRQYPAPPIEIEKPAQEKHTEIGTADTADRIRRGARRRDPRPGRTASSLRTRIGNAREGESWIASDLFGRSRNRFFVPSANCQLRTTHRGG